MGAEYDWWRCNAGNMMCAWIPHKLTVGLEALIVGRPYLQSELGLGFGHGDVAHSCMRCHEVLVDYSSRITNFPV